MRLFQMIADLTGDLPSKLLDIHFLRWIEAAFNMAKRTAYNFKADAERFGDKFATVANSAPSVLYLPVAPSTPDDGVEEVVGKPIPTKNARAGAADIQRQATWV